MPNMSKGSTLNLSKEAPGLKDVMFGAGWDAPEGKDIDLDLSVFALGENGKCRADDDMVYYGSPKVNGKPTGANGKIASSGDNRTGAGDGDDETISANLDSLDSAIKKLVVVLTRYDNGDAALGEVSNAYIRAVNNADSKELAKYSLAGQPDAKSLTLGELSREADGWHFKAIGEYSPKGLSELSTQYGL